MNRSATARKFEDPDGFRRTPVSAPLPRRGTDRGCQYTSGQLSRFAHRHNLARSVGRTGVCWDNAAAESFWATLKVEFYDRYLWVVDPLDPVADRKLGRSLA